MDGFLQWWNNLPQEVQNGITIAVIGGSAVGAITAIVKLSGKSIAAGWKRFFRKDQNLLPPPQQLLIKVETPQPLPPAKESEPSQPSTHAPHLPRPPVVGFVARRDKDGRDIVALLKTELAPERSQLIVLWGKGGIAKTLHELGRLAQSQGEIDEARRLYNESLEINKKLGDQSGIPLTLNNLAMIAQDEGETVEARRLYNESLEIKKKLGDQSGIATTLHNLGNLAEKEGDKAEAARLFREALSIFEKLGSPNAEIVRHTLKRVEGESDE